MEDDVRDPRGDGELPAQARLAVAVLRDRGPTPDALRRLRAGLGVPDPGGPDGGSESSPQEQAPEPSPDPSLGGGVQAAGSSAALPVVKALAWAGVVAVAGGLWWSATPSDPTEVTPTPAPTTSTAATTPETTSSTQRRISPSASASSSSATQILPASASPNAKSSKAAEDGPSEVELINRAQQLVRSRPEAALSLCHQHARRYPNGMLAQEREVLIVEALHRMGREDEARKKSRSFLEENPDTALRNKVENLTGDAATEKR